MIVKIVVDIGKPSLMNHIGHRIRHKSLYALNVMVICWNRKYNTMITEITTALFFALASIRDRRLKSTVPNRLQLNIENLHISEGESEGDPGRVSQGLPNGTFDTLSCHLLISGTL